MGIRRLFNSSPSQSVEKRSISFGSGFFSSSSSTATVDGSLNFIPVYACVRLLSESVASLPLDVYRKASSGDRVELAAPNWIKKPNAEQTTFEFIEQVMCSLNTWGNAYVFVVRDSNASIVELWPLNPASVVVSRDSATNELTYTVNTKRVPTEGMLHIKAFSRPGDYLGLSPIAMGSAGILAGKATDSFAHSYWDNGGNPSGLLTVKNSDVDDEYMAALKEAWNGAVRSGAGTALLQGDFEYKPLTIPAEHAQFLQTRKFQVEEICRLFRVPPHLVQDLERSTNNNIEHQGIDFVTHSLRPWLKRIEDHLTLLLPGNQYVKFNEKALLRGDSQAQAESLKAAWEHGVISANEWRETLDKPAVEGGDARYVPLNFAPATNSEPSITEKANAYKTLRDAGVDDAEARRLAGLPEGVQ